MVLGSESVQSHIIRMTGGGPDWVAQCRDDLPNQQCEAGSERMARSLSVDSQPSVEEGGVSPPMPIQDVVGSAAPTEEGTAGGSHVGGIGMRFRWRYMANNCLATPVRVANEAAPSGSVSVEKLYEINPSIHIHASPLCDSVGAPSLLVYNTTSGKPTERIDSTEWIWSDLPMHDHRPRDGADIGDATVPSDTSITIELFTSQLSARNIPVRTKVGTGFTYLSTIREAAVSTLNAIEAAASKGDGDAIESLRGVQSNAIPIVFTVPMVDLAASSAPKGEIQMQIYADCVSPTGGSSKHGLDKLRFHGGKTQYTPEMIQPILADMQECANRHMSTYNGVASTVNFWDRVHGVIVQEANGFRPAQAYFDSSCSTTALQNTGDGVEHPKRRPFCDLGFMENVVDVCLKGCSYSKTDALRVVESQLDSTDPDTEHPSPAFVGIGQKVAEILTSLSTSLEYTADKLITKEGGNGHNVSVSVDRWERIEEQIQGNSSVASSGDCEDLARLIVATAAQFRESSKSMSPQTAAKYPGVRMVGKFLQPYMITAALSGVTSMKLEASSGKALGAHMMGLLVPKAWARANMVMQGRADIGSSTRATLRNMTSTASNKSKHAPWEHNLDVIPLEGTGRMEGWARPCVEVVRDASVSHLAKLVHEEKSVVLKSLEMAKSPLSGMPRRREQVAFDFAYDPSKVGTWTQGAIDTKTNAIIKPESRSMSFVYSVNEVYARVESGDRDSGDDWAVGTFGIFYDASILPAGSPHRVSYDRAVSSGVSKGEDNKLRYVYGVDWEDLAWKHPAVKMLMIPVMKSTDVEAAAAMTEHAHPTATLRAPVKGAGAPASIAGPLQALIEKWNGGRGEGMAGVAGSAGSATSGSWNAGTDADLHIGANGDAEMDGDDDGSTAILDFYLKPAWLGNEAVMSRISDAILTNKTISHVEWFDSTVLVNAPVAKLRLHFDVDKCRRAVAGTELIAALASFSV